jgi:hypothetical protein
MKHSSVQRISIFLTIISLILWSISITQARFEIGKFGLIGGFPFLFFVSLGILTIASALLWTSKEHYWRLLLTQLCFLVISLFMAHLLVGGAQPLYAWSVGELGNPEYIIRTGHINPSIWQLWQHNWPSNDIFQSVMLLFTGNNTGNFADFLPWLPIIWQALLFFPVFIFLKNTISEFNPNYLWAGMWIFYLASWPGIQNNGPQPFGTFLAFSVLAILSSFEIWRKNVSSLGHRALIVIILLAVTTGHFLSSLVAFSTSMGSFVSRRLQSIAIPLFACLFIILWAVFGAGIYNTVKIPVMIDRALTVGQAIQSGISNQISSSESHSVVSLIRLVFSGMFLLIASIGGIIAFKFKRNRYLDISVLSVLIANGILAIIIGSGYSHELFNRFFIYFLPVLVYFSVKLLDFRFTAALLAILLIIGLPFSFVSQYGNQEMDYLSSANINGVYNFQQYTSHGEITGAGPAGLMRNAEAYHTSSIDDIYNDNGDLDIKFRNWAGDPYAYLPHYVNFDNCFRARMDFYLNKPEVLLNLQKSLDTISHCNRIFSNPDMDLYLGENSQQIKQ